MDAAKAQEERIAARRKIVEDRVRAKNAGPDVEAQNTEEAEELGRGERQISESRRKLEGMKALGTDEVTKIRIDTDVEENERRIHEENARETRHQKMADEAASSERRNASIQMRWQALYDKSIPQDLMSAIDAQKEACSKILSSKEKLVNEFSDELKGKNEEYVKALKKQTADIDNLIEAMHVQTKALAKAYEEELDEVETAFMEERNQLLENYRKELEQAIEARRTKETKNREARRDRIDEEQNRLDTIHENYAEQYNLLKTKLQKEIQGLEQQLEEMRALYQLNAEKLEYNLRVLTERVKENEKAIQQNKRKLARLQDVLSSLITKYSDSDKRFRHDNNIVTDQYRKITEQYRELQKRFQYFERADTEKYRKVWEMNEEECMGLVDKALDADRVIYEQQLGVEWKPHSTDFWGDTRRQHAEESTLAAEAQSEEEEEEEEIDYAHLNDNTRSVLDLIVSQESFLSPVPLKDSPMEERYRAIMTALNVRTKAELTKLEQYFTSAGHAENGEDILILIDPQDANVALKQYLEKREKNRASTSKVKRTKAKAQHQQAKEERDYWNRMGKVIPEGSLRVWSGLEKGLEKYITLLQDRSRLIDETDAIRQQNDELRALLNQYMQSGINEELFVPPQLTLAPQG